MGAKESSHSWFSFCLLASAILNIYFVWNSYIEGKVKVEVKKLSWSEEAAAEAEAVASIYCSNHGRAFVDGVTVDGKPICECSTCYGGYDCSLFLPDCAADADSGDPMFLEPFWVQNAAKSALLVSGWHRMSYNFPHQTAISQELEKHIRILHDLAKNAKTDDKYIVFGGGSTQLLNAAVYALSMNLSSPASVVAATPAYPVRALIRRFNQTQSSYQDDHVSNY